MSFLKKIKKTASRLSLRPKKDDEAGPSTPTSTSTPPLPNQQPPRLAPYQNSANLSPQTRASPSVLSRPHPSPGHPQPLSSNPVATPSPPTPPTIRHPSPTPSRIRRTRDLVNHTDTITNRLREVLVTEETADGIEEKLKWIDAMLDRAASGQGESTPSMSARRRAVGSGSGSGGYGGYNDYGGGGSGHGPATMAAEADEEGDEMDNRDNRKSTYALLGALDTIEPPEKKSPEYRGSERGKEFNRPRERKDEDKDQGKRKGKADFDVFRD